MNKEQALRQLKHLLGNPDIVDSEDIDKIDTMLCILYPEGIQLDRYIDMIRTVRVLEHLCQTIQPGDQNQVQAQTPFEPAIVEPVDDDATAPLLEGPLFTRSPENRNANMAMGEFGLRRQVAERKPRMAHYKSILKSPSESGQENDRESGSRSLPGVVDQTDQAAL